MATKAAKAAQKYRAGTRPVKARISDVTRGYAAQAAAPAKGRTTVSQLAARLARTEAKVRSLERELAALRVNGAEEPVIVLRDVDKDQAKREIRELFQKEETLYYGDIEEKLGIELSLVVEICNELMAEGEIEVDANALQSR